MRPLFFTGLMLVCCAYSGVLSSNTTSEEERFLIGGEKSPFRWPGVVIPYEIAEGYFTAKQIQLILRAFKEFADKTACITFIPKRSTDKGFVSIYRGRRCFSMVGNTGQMQGLSLGEECLKIGTILHELMHAVGFFHEQSRSDRDRYVRINGGNIRSDHIQFAITDRRFQPTDLGFPYDLDSVMHYRSNAFSIRRDLNTIETLRTSDQSRIDKEKKTFSRTDLKRLDKLCSFEPCYDTIGYDAWCAGWRNPASDCQRSNVKKHCRKYCKLCTPGKKTPTRRPTVKKAIACSDKKKSCPKWAKKNYCVKKYVKYMKKNCQKSCGATCYTYTRD